MKAVRIHEHGNVNVLRYDEVPIPSITDDLVLVKIHTAAMNHLDIWVRKGIPGVPLPCILGSDGAGEIVEIGSNISSYAVGDRMMIQPLTFCGTCKYCLSKKENYCDSWGILGENQNGTQCEYIAVSEVNLRPIPAHLSYEQAAAFSLVAQTAYAMLVRRAKINAGENIFVWGGTSGVGSMGIQISKALGCQVYTAVGNEEKAAVAKELGADHVADYTEMDISKWMMDLTEGYGADVVMEHVGAATWKTSLAILAKGGRIVTCGATTGPIVNVDLRHLFYKQQTILGSTMGDMAAYDEALDMLNKKQIYPVIGKSFPMENIQEAHTYLENNRQIGNVVLIP